MILPKSASSSTVIDNVITILANTVISVITTEISDHHGVQVVIKNVLPEIDPENYQTKRSFSPRNVQSFIDSLEKEDWAFLDSYSSPCEMYNHFEICLLFHLNRNLPLKKVKTFRNCKINTIGSLQVFGSLGKPLNGIPQYR